MSLLSNYAISLYPTMKGLQTDFVKTFVQLERNPSYSVSGALAFATEVQALLAAKVPRILNAAAPQPWVPSTAPAFMSQGASPAQQFARALDLASLQGQREQIMLEAVELQVFISAIVYVAAGGPPTPHTHPMHATFMEAQAALGRLRAAWTG
jgi:hypothetical protein